jgi:hypothetical protein
MNEVLSKLERLRELIKGKEAQTETPAPLEPSINESAPPEPERVTLATFDPDKRPKSLEGLSVGEILLLEQDGGLDPEAEEWVSLKNIPNPDGSIRLPNIRALARRAKRLSGDS